jgi:beta-lactamase class A
MGLELTRRALLSGTGVTLAAACVAACTPREAPTPPRAPAPPHEPEPCARLEASLGGRVGLFALDTGNGRHLAHRADERFAMASTFKWALGAAVLARVDRGELALGERVPYGESDLLEHAPVTGAHLAEGAMTLEALVEAAITVSDNTAANLLLAKIDGPAGLTRFLRQLGDAVTRLDRNEPTLNTNLPGDPRDTTSPAAMVGTMKAVLTGEALSPASRDRLLGWLKQCRTGLERLRAGWPTSWIAGDKTGTGERGAVNDIAIVWPPRRAPLLVASYLSDGSAPLAALTAAQAEIGRSVAAWVAEGG